MAIAHGRRARAFVIRWLVVASLVLPAGVWGMQERRALPDAAGAGLRSQAVIADGLGATILPSSMAAEGGASCAGWHCRSVEPGREAALALWGSEVVRVWGGARAGRERLGGVGWGVLF